MARILLAEDDPSLRDVVEKVLTGEGHDVSTVQDGKKALVLLHSSAFDLVITDLVMPDVDGIELIIKIKKMCPQVKIIAASGGENMRFGHLRAAQLLGADLLLPKPFSKDELLTMVNYLLDPTEGPLP
jgi:CheY-like chemotaxis protein